MSKRRHSKSTKRKIGRGVTLANRRGKRTNRKSLKVAVVGGSSLVGIAGAGYGVKKLAKHLQLREDKARNNLEVAYEDVKKSNGADEKSMDKLSRLQNTFNTARKYNRPFKAVKNLTKRKRKK